ncbi:MAG: sulfotransferase family 2 domain-containing protein [Bacteroidetes bacterium]|nr:sulfotransferase family 2 domain-containing protein [Bacteroidota bacterium]
MIDISWYEFHKNIEPYKSLKFEKYIKYGMPHHWEKQNETNYIKENISPLLQYNFVDQCKVDFIGKIENFENDLKTIVDKLNRIYVQSNFKKRFKYKNKKINKSKRNSNIDSYYTNETKEIVYTLLKKDFLYFGYKK